MNKLLPIGAAARALDVSTDTLRCWEASGRLTPARTEGGQRRDDLAALLPGRFHGALTPRRTVAYARVSSHDQKADLARQREVLERYCASQGWPFEVIADLGSGMNHHKKGLNGVKAAVESAQSC
ncbi:recombinase family protein [Massilia sp. LXY-6]|uniref:IS607 family transposase n=1 Tax=Massilia sp. LXY-6 TaxID=3379823 RepID=UPI003EE205C9